MEILKFKKINKTTSEILIKLDAAEIADEYKVTLDDLVKEAEIPGFRPGKAPRGRVERHYGIDEIWRMARDGAAYDAFDKALDEKELTFSDDPDFEHTDYDGEGEYEFKVTFCPEPLTGEDDPDDSKEHLADRKVSDEQRAKNAADRKKRIRRRQAHERTQQPTDKNLKAQTIKSSKKPG
jgi:trigger factor